MTVLFLQLPVTAVVETTDVFGGLLDGLMRQLAAEPWLGVLFVLLLVHGAIRRIPGLVHGRRRRDPQRCFPRDDKRLIIRRAGQRCEHHSWLRGRCPVTD